MAFLKKLGSKLNKEAIQNIRDLLKEGTYTNLDNVIFKWLLAFRSSNVAISASIWKIKAEELPEKMSIKDFQASDGWLDR